MRTHARASASECGATLHAPPLESQSASNDQLRWMLHLATIVCRAVHPLCLSRPRCRQQLANWVRCHGRENSDNSSDVSTAFAIALTNPTTPRPFLSRAGGSEGHSQEDHTFQGCHGCPSCTSSPSSQHSPCCTRGPSLRRTCTPSFPSSGDWRALYRKCMLS
jgi:hypothetical protein